MLQKVLLIFLFLNLIRNGSCDCSNSELSTLSNCYYTYFHMLNTDANGYWETADDYFDTADDVDTLCRYYGSLQTCLGSNIVNHCVNHDGFWRTFGGSYSYEFTADYFELQFTCGSGKKALKNELNCLQNLNTGCNGLVKTCSAAEEYIDCYANAAKKSCGKDGYYYAKNEVSIRYCYSDLQCDTCTSDANFGGLSFFVIFASVIFLLFFS